MIFSIAWFIMIFWVIVTKLLGVTIAGNKGENLLTLIKLILIISVVFVTLDIVRSGTLIIRFIASCLLR